MRPWRSHGAAAGLVPFREWIRELSPPAGACPGGGPLGLLGWGAAASVHGSFCWLSPCPACLAVGPVQAVGPARAVGSGRAAGPGNPEIGPRAEAAVVQMFALPVAVLACFAAPRRYIRFPPPHAGLRDRPGASHAGHCTNRPLRVGQVGGQRGTGWPSDRQPIDRQLVHRQPVNRQPVCGTPVGPNPVGGQPPSP